MDATRPSHTYVQQDDGTIEATCATCGEPFTAHLSEGWTPYDPDSFRCGKCRRAELVTHDEHATGRHKR